MLEYILKYGVIPAINFVLSLIYVKNCALCNQKLSCELPLCSQCWGKIDFEMPLYLCRHCGFLLPETEDNANWDQICLACLQKPSSFDGTVACVAYNDVIRELILTFKTRDGLHLRPILAHLLAISFARFPDIDILMPVPLHPLRLWQRRYNQSALLAFALAKLLDTDQVLVGVLRRARYTKKQKGSPQKRWDNLKNAFIVPAKKRQFITGKRIALIDDVLTSGATLEHCAMTLKQAGASEVYGLTIARVVSPRPVLR